MLLKENNFNNYLNNNFFFEKKPDVCVAVSGGPDSIALLFLVKKWTIKNKGNLTALIVDHQIRKESFLEAKEVKNYLMKKKINCKILSVRKKKYQK